jgi:translation elongation factor EF-Tu-like GTPase
LEGDADSWKRNPTADNDKAMKITARYKLLKSHTLGGRGIVLMGDILDGQVKTGDFITFSTGREQLTLQIAGVEMTDDQSTGEYWVGLTFLYKGHQQKKALENLEIPIQVVDIIGK